MAFTLPSPQTWTLRLKSRKTTVLLHVDPLHTFSTIKSHLYTALQETGFRDPETGEQIPLPTSPSDIQLARPVNPNEARQGFQLGEWEYSAIEEDEEEDVKGKGKAKAGRPQKLNNGGMNVKDCPKGAGLRDGAVLAFRWQGSGDDEHKWNGIEEEYVERNAGIKKPDMWGVKLASFEDSYGVENEIDVGGVREFEG